MSRHTYEMGIIGNCAYTALIDKRAEVKWLCWPRFDSSFVFGSLLSEEKGGRFAIVPEGDDYETIQYYLQNTNILVTEFTGVSGRFRVYDYAPRFAHLERYFKPLMLFRKIEWLNGDPRVRVICEPRYEYGSQTPAMQMGSNHLRFSGFGQEVRLTTNISLNYILEGKAFALTEIKYLVLSWGIPMEGPLESTAEEFLRKTTRYWHEWVRQCKIGEFHQEAAIRSALTLKIHQYEDTGAIIASPTTSLPEHPGSGRNWDYRYCWMRDTFYTLKALHDVGHFHEMENYAKYIQNIALSESGRYQPVYTITGGLDFEEYILPLEGYRGNNAPVRIGNQAKEHIQNDVYGQVLVSLLPLYVDKRFIYPQRAHTLPVVEHLLNMIDQTMDEPDAGLWEFRNFAQKHSYTFFFHWAGANAALRIARATGQQAMAEKAQKLIGKARAQLEACYNEERKVYTQAIGTPHLDAALLQLITLGYLNPDSERARLHLRALEERLMTEDGLFYRYLHEDDFGKPKSTFMVCSFWHVEALAAVGRPDEAIDKFERLLKYSNHLGLFSEDVDATDGSQWGNFPQTYSHVGLMNAASRIVNKLSQPNFLTEKY